MFAEYIFLSALHVVCVQMHTLDPRHFSSFTPPPLIMFRGESYRVMRFATQAPGSAAASASAEVRKQQLCNCILFVPCFFVVVALAAACLHPAHDIHMHITGRSRENAFAGSGGTKHDALWYLACRFDCTRYFVRQLTSPPVFVPSCLQMVRSFLPSFFPLLCLFTKIATIFVFCSSGKYATDCRRGCRFHGRRRRAAGR